MTAIQRIRVRWENFRGAPGVNTFYASDVATVVPALQDFYAGIVTRLPQGLQITVEQSGETIEDTTGVAVGAWSTGSPEAPVAGSGDNFYPGGQGAILRMKTAGYVNGRRVQGRVFLIPLGGLQFDDGSLSSLCLGVLRPSAQALLNASMLKLLVLSTPYTPPAGSTKPARLGSSHVVTEMSVPDFAAVLRSRRD